MKKLLVVSLAVVLVVAFAVSGCGDGVEPTAPDYIRIGHVSTIEGMYAGFGEGALWGIEAAIEDINALGGVYVEEWDEQIPLQLYTRECTSDETAVAGHTEYLIDTNEVVGIVGAFIPPPIAAPQVPIVETAGVPLLQTPGPYEPWMAMRGPYEPVTYTFTTTFRIATDPDPYVPGYLIKEIGFEFHEALGVTNQTHTMGVFASNDGDGAGWFALMGAMLDDAGYTTSTWEDDSGLFEMDTIDYSSIYNQWITDNVTAIWGNCPPPHFIDLWTQAYAAGFRPEVIFAAREGLFWTDMDGLEELAIGIGLESWWHNAYDPVLCPGAGNTTPQSLFDRWVADTDQPLNPNIGWGYANVQILADAIEEAGSLDGDDIRAALLAGEFTTIAGPVDYGSADLNCPVPLHYFQWFWDEGLDTVVPEVVVSQHDFLATTDTAFLITYP
jgi:branched-chain amino acid transport system substrate-binding protein